VGVVASVDSNRLCVRSKGHQHAYCDWAENHGISYFQCRTEPLTSASTKVALSYNWPDGEDSEKEKAEAA
jgi:hypothetical protein